MSLAAVEASTLPLVQSDTLFSAFDGLADVALTVPDFGFGVSIREFIQVLSRGGADVGSALDLFADKLTDSAGEILPTVQQSLTDFLSTRLNLAGRVGAAGIATDVFGDVGAGARGASVLQQGLRAAASTLAEQLEDAIDNASVGGQRLEDLRQVLSLLRRTANRDAAPADLSVTRGRLAARDRLIDAILRFNEQREVALGSQRAFGIAGVPFDADQARFGAARGLVTGLEAVVPRFERDLFAGFVKQAGLSEELDALLGRSDLSAAQLAVFEELVNAGQIEQSSERQAQLQSQGREIEKALIALQSNAQLFGQLAEISFRRVGPSGEIETINAADRLREILTLSEDGGPVALQVTFESILQFARELLAVEQATLVNRQRLLETTVREGNVERQRLAFRAGVEDIGLGAGRRLQTARGLGTVPADIAQISAAFSQTLAQAAQARGQAEQTAIETLRQKGLGVDSEEARLTLDKIRADFEEAQAKARDDRTIALLKVFVDEELRFQETLLQKTEAAVESASSGLKQVLSNPQSLFDEQGLLQTFKAVFDPIGQTLGRQFSGVL